MRRRSRPPIPTTTDEAPPPRPTLAGRLPGFCLFVVPRVDLVAAGLGRAASRLLPPGPLARLPWNVWTVPVIPADEVFVEEARRALGGAGKPPDAVAPARDRLLLSLRLRPFRPLAWGLLAQLEATAGTEEGVERALGHALRLAPFHPDVNRLAFEHYWAKAMDGDEGAVARASSSFRRAARGNALSDRYDALSRLALVEPDPRRLERIVPRTPGCLEALARCFRDQGRHGMAARIYESIARRKRDPHWWVLAGTCLLDGGYLERARLTFLTGLKQIASPGRYLSEVYARYYERYLFADGASLLREAPRHRAGIPDLHLQTARALLDSGRAREAFQVLDAVPEGADLASYEELRSEAAAACGLPRAEAAAVAARDGGAPGERRGRDDR